MPHTHAHTHRHTRARGCVCARTHTQREKGYHKHMQTHTKSYIHRDNEYTHVPTPVENKYPGNIYSVKMYNILVELTRQKYPKIRFFFILNVIIN